MTNLPEEVNLRHEFGDNRPLAAHLNHYSVNSLVQGRVTQNGVCLCLMT